MTFIISIFIVAIIFLIPAAACLLLWNLILIPIFNLPEISFWMMYGLVWFFRLISGSLIDELLLTSAFGNNDDDDIFDMLKGDE